MTTDEETPGNTYPGQSDSFCESGSSPPAIEGEPGAELPVPDAHKNSAVVAEVGRLVAETRGALDAGDLASAWLSADELYFLVHEGLADWILDLADHNWDANGATHYVAARIGPVGEYCRQRDMMDHGVGRHFNWTALARVGLVARVVRLTCGLAADAAETMFLRADVPDGMRERIADLERALPALEPLAGRRLHAVPDAGD
ncbi:MAG: hypothetical protein ACYC8T_27655 [Myxococcaceae bacterium]